MFNLLIVVVFHVPHITSTIVVLCREGCLLQSLLSHKYGYTAFPRVIEAGEFETLMQHVSDTETRNLFNK